ncbi:MAG: glycosyltransferase family 1 protein [Candidatus Omnitrophota bacterium]|jgi:glycosyltransferase involved in cell wall biosynthesis
MTRHRVGLDIRMLQNSGIGTYLRGLLSGLRTLGLDRDLALFGPKPAETRPGHIFSAPIYSIREQLQYPALLRQCRLWHAPHYNIPLWKGKTKLVVTIHDIIHWIFRKQFLSPAQIAYAGFMLKKAVTSADQIIAVSHHTQKDLITHFHAPEQKITVIHEGADETYREIPSGELQPAFEKIQAKYGIPHDFFLYVGLIKPHKNVLMLVRLFHKLKEQGKVRASLVLIGRKDRTYPPGYEALAALSSTKDILYLPAIDPRELKVFYSQALALVHPSLYEGFGLTLLEAMCSGTPVLTTNSSSIPEVVGDAALRVDATDEIAMMDALIRLDQDRSLRESLRLKGFERVKIFSWRETARKTTEVYEKALAGK